MQLNKTELKLLEYYLNVLSCTSCSANKTVGKRARETRERAKERYPGKTWKINRPKTYSCI